MTRYGLLLMPFFFWLRALSIAQPNPPPPKMVDENNQWNVLFSSGPAYSNYRTLTFKFQDTLHIGGQVYHKLWSTYDTLALSGFSFTGAYRQEQGKVFQWNSFNNTENLAFDFSLTPGDTFIIEPNISLVVQAIDTVFLLNGQGRKRLELNLANNSWDAVYWIEGIGGTTGVFNPSSAFIFDSDNRLMCFSQNGELQYFTGASGDGPVCVYHSTGISEEEIAEGSWSVFPNPACNQLFLQGRKAFSQPAAFLLYHSTGQLLERKDSKAGDSRLEWDISALAPGLYFLHIRQKRQAVQMVGFVKR